MGIAIGLFFVGVSLSTGGLFLLVPLWFIVVVCIGPLLYAYWMYTQDRLEAEPLELIALSLGWGAFSAFLVILLWMPLLLANVDITNIPAWIAGPLPEEPLKILGVYWLATHKRLGKEFNDHLDGIVYGAAAGAGFAIAENFGYILRMWIVLEVPLFSAVLVRSTIGHVFLSGLVGRWLGLAKIRKGYIKKVDLIPGLAVAMAIHGLWNFLVTTPLLEPIWLFFYSIGGDYGIIIPIFLIASPFYCILYKYVKEALRDEKLWGYSVGYAPVECGT